MCDSKAIQFVDWSSHSICKQPSWLLDSSLSLCCLSAWLLYCWYYVLLLVCCFTCVIDVENFDFLYDGLLENPRKSNFQGGGNYRFLQIWFVLLLKAVYGNSQFLRVTPPPIYWAIASVVSFFLLQWEAVSEFRHCWDNYTTNITWEILHVLKQRELL